MAKQKKKSPPNLIRLVKQNLLPIGLSILLVILTVITYQIVIADKYSPLTFVGDTNISFLTQGQAIRKVESRFQKRAEQKLSFSTDQDSFTIDIATSSAALDYSALTSAFKENRQGSLISRLGRQIQTIFLLSKISPKINLSLDKQLDNIASLIDKPPQNAQLIFDETPSPEGTPSAHIQIKEGIDGLALDKNAVEKVISDFLLTGQYNSELPLKTIPPVITTNQVVRAKQALEGTMQEPIKLTFGTNTWVLDTKQLLTLLDLTKGDSLLLDKDQTSVYLKKIAAEIDQNVQEGLFEFNPATKRVTAFKPSQEGRKLDIDKTFKLLSETLTSDSPKTIILPVATVKPKIATSDVNSLGIKELLGRGISNFAGSIENRIYNIGLTASKINGVLVPPGEIFSFNQTVGDITAQTGFKQAYVIKEGRTVLDDGGGVCQDSTTLFRAVLNAGLPVVKRTAHAYRVGYYEQGFPPGLDATVFYPSVDFQFKNDTSAHILIQAYTYGTTLYIDLYGTPDGRVVSLTQPVVTNQTPPPPELRQDDPTLPKGTVKQVDWAAWGANVSFKRIVTRNGQTLIDETWKSFYKPWQAVFLVGTKEN
ncbi:VanW family protein [Candidatus Daviesbacteria bacterium]|nr:VanW family protein [Candidatus Daviesbacteria bacterium]